MSIASMSELCFSSRVDLTCILHVRALRQLSIYTILQIYDLERLKESIKFKRIDA